MITQEGEARTQSITTEAGSWAAWTGFQTHLQMRAELGCCRWGGRGQEQGCRGDTAAPCTQHSPSAACSPGTQGLSFLSWLAWLTSRQGKKSHSFTAKAGRLCSDGQERCLLYPDTINAVLVTWETVLPLLWPRISQTRAGCCRLPVPLLPFHLCCDWAVNPAGWGWTAACTNYSPKEPAFLLRKDEDCTGSMKYP